MVFAVYLYEKRTDMYKIYDAIIEGYEDINPCDYARGIVWCEMEYVMQDTLPYYHRYIDTIEGVDIYYDYGADYYFFVEKVTA